MYQPSCSVKSPRPKRSKEIQTRQASNCKITKLVSVWSSLDLISNSNGCGQKKHVWIRTEIRLSPRCIEIHDRLVIDFQASRTRLKQTPEKLTPQNLQSVSINITPVFLSTPPGILISQRNRTPKTS